MASWHLAACGGGVAPAADPPLPEPDLSASEPAVRDQIREARARLEATLADADAPAASRGEAYGQLGLLYLLYDFLEAAEPAFERATAAAPADFRWPYLQGYVDQIRGRLEPAILHYTRALELEPAYVPAIVRLASARLESGDPGGARAGFQRALDLDSGSAAAHEGLGRLAEVAGDLEAAAQHLERALELQPEASRLHYALAQLYRRLGDEDRAERELEASGPVGVRIADSVLEPLGEIARSAQFFLMQGGEAMEDEDYPTAAAAYARAVELDPGSFLAYRGLSYARERMGDLPGAVAALEEGLELGTGEDAAEEREERAEIRHLVGGLRALQGDDEGAIEAFRASLALRPDAPGVRRKLANALARTGRFEESLRELDRLLEENPEYEAPLLGLRATVLVNLGRGEDALASFRRALELAPDDANLRRRYAAALEFLGDSEGAERERRRLESALRESPEELTAVDADEGRRLLGEGRLEEALERFERAAERDPERWDVRYQRAAVLGELGRLDEALGEFRAVIEAEPRHAAARRGEITALLLGDRYGEARVRLREALATFPRDARFAHLQARLLATAPDPAVRDGRLALEISRRLTADVATSSTLETLALSLAEAGRRQEALGLLDQVVAGVRSQGGAREADALARLRDAVARDEGWRAGSGREILAAAGGPLKGEGG